MWHPQNKVELVVVSQVSEHGYGGKHPAMGVTVDGTPEVREMVQKAAHDAADGQTPSAVFPLPTIDPESLTPSQQAGSRCAVPNCRRLLADVVRQVGRLPTGEPVLACGDCALKVSYEIAREFQRRGMIPEQHQHGEAA